MYIPGPATNVLSQQATEHEQSPHDTTQTPSHYSTLLTPWTALTLCHTLLTLLTTESIHIHLHTTHTPSHSPTFTYTLPTLHTSQALTTHTPHTTGTQTAHITGTPTRYPHSFTLPYIHLHTPHTAHITGTHHSHSTHHRHSTAHITGTNRIQRSWSRSKRGQWKVTVAPGLAVMSIPCRSRLAFTEEKIALILIPTLAINNKHQIRMIERLIISYQST